MYGYTLNTQTHYTMLISTRFDIYLYIYIYTYYIHIYTWIPCCNSTSGSMALLLCKYDGNEYFILFSLPSRNPGNWWQEYRWHIVGKRTAINILPVNFHCWRHNQNTCRYIYIYSGNIHIIIYMYLMRPLCLNNV